MQLTLHYLQLRKGFPSIGEGEPVEVTMETLAGMLYCSSRNAKLILVKMVEAEWVDFVSGLGRGNHSTLTFRIPIEPIVIEEAKRNVERGELQVATDLIKQFGNELVRDRFSEWFSNTFGFQIDRKESSLIETLRFPVFRPITTFDPAEVFYIFDGHMVNQVFDTLVLYNPHQKRLEGKIAHDWESNSEATEWIVYVRKGVLFHHGRECVAEDVRQSLLRLRDGGYAQSWLVSSIMDIEILDSYSVRIRLLKPNYLFMRYLCFPPTAIVPVEVCSDPDHLFSKYPVGTGPFQVANHTEEVCLLEAFPSYFFGRPRLDRVEIVMLPEDSIAYIKAAEHSQMVVNTGDTQPFTDTTWKDLEGVYEGSSLLTFNLNKAGPQTNLAFRQAIHQILDRNAMIEELGYPRLLPSYGLHWASSLNKVDDEQKPIEVNQVLKQIGYNGQPLQLYVYPRHAADAEWIRSRCEANGIRINVTTVSWDQMLQKEIIQSADCVLFEAVLSEGQVSEMELYQYSNSFVRLHFPKDIRDYVDQQLDRIIAESSDEHRQQLFGRIEQYIKDSYALLFLVHKKLQTAFPPSIRGVRVNTRGWIDFYDVWYQRHRDIWNETS